MTKAGKILVCLVLTVLCAFTALVPVGAAIDTSRNGSVTFTITSSDTGKNIGGGSIAVYRVASLNSDGTYTLEDDFASLDIDINEVAASDSKWSQAAEDIALYIKNHELEDKATVVSIGEDGTATLDDVPTGLYVAVQKEVPEGYTAFKPFIIPVPYHSGSSLQYDIDARPKGTSRLPADGCPVVFPVVSKSVRGAEAPVKKEFRFRFRALEQNYPEIINSSGSVENGGDVVSQSADEIVVRTVGEGNAEVGSITFDTPGDYYFEVSEINTHEAGIQYDKTVYWCKYSIGYNEDQSALIVSSITVKNTDANGKQVYEGTDPQAFTFSFINSVSKTPYKGDLPQTGQFWWPVIILAPLGTAALVFGVVLLKRGKKKGKNEQKG